MTPSKTDPNIWTIAHKWDMRPWYAPNSIQRRSQDIGSAEDLERAIAGGDKFAEKTCGRDVMLQ